MSHRKVVHPSPQDRVDPFDHPPYRLAGEPPFESASSELDHAAFPQGLCDLLVADLSKLEGVHVVSPSTVRRHQRLGISMGLMGRLLGLDVLVEGTIQTVSARVRITPRLVDVHTGKVIWAESYHYSETDLGEVQTEAARVIAAQVGAHLAIHGQLPVHL